MARTRDVGSFVIDFSKEEQGAGGGIRVKEGTYKVKILAAKPITAEEKGTPGLELSLVFMEGKYRKKKTRERLWATPKAYARFRALLEACGKKSPQRVNIARIARAVVGEELYVELADESRDGYPTRSRVTFEGFISVDDYDEDEAEDEEEDEDLDEDEDLEEADDEDDEDEEEEEEPAPRRRRSKAKAAPAKRRRKKAVDEDEDDDELDLDSF